MYWQTRSDLALHVDQSANVPNIRPSSHWLLVTFTDNLAKLVKRSTTLDWRALNSNGVACQTRETIRQVAHDLNKLQVVAWETH